MISPKSRVLTRLDTKPPQRAILIVHENWRFATPSRQQEMSPVEGGWCDWSIGARTLVTGCAVAEIPGGQPRWLLFVWRLSRETGLGIWKHMHDVPLIWICYPRQVLNPTPEVIRWRTPDSTLPIQSYAVTRHSKLTKWNTSESASVHPTHPS